MDYLFSIIFYLSSFVMASFLIWAGERYKSRILVLCGLLIPIAIVGLKFLPDPEMDYLRILDASRAAKEVSMADFLADGIGVAIPNTEIGTFFLMKISLLLSGDGYIFFALLAALTIFPMYAALKKLNIPNRHLIVLGFLLVIFPGTYGGSRQYVAVSISALAFAFLYRKDILKACLLFLIALAFHTSVLFVLPIFIIAAFLPIKKGITNKKFLLVVAISLLLVTVSLTTIGFTMVEGVPFLNERYGVYIEKAEHFTNQDAGYLVRWVSKILLVISGTICAVRRKGSLAREDIRILTVLIIFSFSDVALTSWSLTTPMRRLGAFFTIGSLSLVASQASIMHKRGIVMLMIFLVYSFGYFIVICCLLNNFSMVPYTPLWLAEGV